MSRRTLRLGLSVFLLVSMTGSTAAQQLRDLGDQGSTVPDRKGTKVPHPAATEIAISTYDGTLEDGLAFTTPGDTQFVQRLDLPSSTSSLLAVEACFASLTPYNGFDFEFLIYAGNAQPGALIDRVVPLTDTPLTSTGFDCFTLGLITPISLSGRNRIFFGVEFDQGRFPESFLATDANGTNTGPIFGRQDGGAWNAIIPGVDTSSTNLGMAALVDDGKTQPPPTGPCQSSSTTLCLLDDRFQVEVDYETDRGETGQGRVVPGGTDSSANLYFFESDNWEMLIKVLPTCAINDHFWVFFAATTDLGLDVTVTDTDTETVKTYTNPVGNPANAVTDTSAFATCP